MNVVTLGFIAAWLSSFSALAATPTVDVFADHELVETIEPELTRTVDFLYVGDNTDNTVARFNASTRAYLGDFVTSGSGGLIGPRGVVFNKCVGNKDLLVSNQNTGQPFPGEILRYSRTNGAFIDELVDSSDPQAPFAPQGIVVGWNKVLYVADPGDPSNAALPGRVARYDATNGAFLGNLDLTGYSGIFRPRAVVVGPDGDIYVSSTNQPSLLGGKILRFDQLTGKFDDVVVDSDTCGCDLNAPFGLVFGPDRRLYVTSFWDPAIATSVDRIVIFDIDDGAGFLDDEIELWPPSPSLPSNERPRVFAQGLLFGPAGRLFVPITGGQAGGLAHVGAVRRYNVKSGGFDNFVPPAASGGPLGSPRYLTFGGTNQTTLAYQPGVTICININVND